MPPETLLRAPDLIKCGRCGVPKTPDGYFPSILRQNGKTCRACCLARQKRYYRDHAETQRRKSLECNRRRLLADPDRERAIRRRNMNAFAARRRASLAAARPTWRESHPDLAALIDAEIEAARQWLRARRAAKDRERRQSPGYRQYMQDYRLQNLEREREKTRRWKGGNRSRCNHHNAKREAAKRGSGAENDPAIVAFYEEVRTAPRMKCYLCGRQTKPGERHVDHVVPLNRGGPHVRSNLACACIPCNLGKRDKLPSEMGILL
jgi:5-methylcytosine-specific restriction endonuclease McrA